MSHLPKLLNDSALLRFALILVSVIGSTWGAAMWVNTNIDKRFSNIEARVEKAEGKILLARMEAWPIGAQALFEAKMKQDNPDIRVPDTGDILLKHKGLKGTAAITY